MAKLGTNTGNQRTCLRKQWVSIANCHTYVLSLRMLGNSPTAFRPTSALSLHYSNQRFGNAGANPYVISMFFVLVFSFFPALTPVAKCVQLPQLVSEKARSGRWLSPLGGSCFLTCDKALRRLLSVRSRPARGTISLTVSSQVRGVPGEENREKDAD